MKTIPTIILITNNPTNHLLVSPETSIRFNLTMKARQRKINTRKRIQLNSINILDNVNNWSKNSDCIIMKSGRDG